MRRQKETETTKKKPTQKQESLDYPFDTEISILLPYLKIMPISIQSKLLGLLRQLSEKETLSQINVSTLEQMSAYSSLDEGNQAQHLLLFELFCRFLKLNKLREGAIALSKKSQGRQRLNDHNNQKQLLGLIFQPFEPTVDRSKSKIEPIPSVINPHYQNLVRLYKTFTDVHMNMEYKIKDLNEHYTFYAPPRFMSKLLEVRDFESSFPQKGNIVMLGFEGSKIVGKRGFAFVNQTAIYWWEKNFADYKDILPEVLEDKDKKNQDNNQLKQPTEPFRYNQNFKLSYKMVGHHGKITSLSLSDDEYYLISAGTDKVIKLWCLRQKTLLAEYRGHLKTIWSVSFSKSGYFFLSGSADKTVKLWSTDDSIAQRIYVGHSLDVTKVDFLKNPDLIVSCSEDKTVRIWNTLTASCINVLNFERPAINFKNSISGRYLAACDTAGRLVVYDLLKGQLAASFMVPEKEESNSGKIKYLKIHDICFSMDEKQFSCVSSKYIVIFSFDKICEKESKNLFESAAKEGKERTVATKQVIYTGRDSNLLYCDYHDKGLLLVATTSLKKY